MKGYSTKWSEHIDSDNKDYLRQLINNNQNSFEGMSGEQLEQYEITRKNKQTARAEQEKMYGFD